MAWSISAVKQTFVEHKRDKKVVLQDFSGVFQYPERVALKAPPFQG